MGRLPIDRSLADSRPGRSDSCGSCLWEPGHREERDTVEAAGGNSVSCKSFLEDLNQGASDISQEIQKIKDRPPPGRLGDFFPDM